MRPVDLDNYYNILTLLVNKTFKFTINNRRIEPRFAHYLITRAIHEESIVGRAVNTHLIIYNKEGYYAKNSTSDL